MALEGRRLEDITEADLRELVEAGIPEGHHLDYKRDSYGTGAVAAKEFAKDISALANAGGGHLIIGVDEAEGVPTELRGVGVNGDVEIMRLDNWARTGISPRIIGVRGRVVPLESGAAVLVYRVPRSVNPPHQVVQDHRFYRRASRSNEPMNAEELRELFLAAESAIERARQYRSTRVALFERHEVPFPASEQFPTIILHIIPLSPSRTASYVDVAVLGRDREMARELAAIRGEYDKRHNLDGFVSWCGQSGRYGYTQLFRDGAIEATLPIEDQQINGLVLPSDITRAVTRYRAALQRLGAPGPYVVALSVVRCRKANLIVDHYTRRPFDRGRCDLPEIILDDDGDVKAGLRPIFDALWQAAGEPRCFEYDEDT